MIAQSRFSKALSLVLALGFLVQPLAVQADEVRSIEELQLDLPEEFDEEEASLLSSSEREEIAQDVIVEAQLGKSEAHPDSKCTADYKKWKKRLGWKVALTLPITLAAAYAGGALVGGSAVAISKAFGATYSSFEDLALFIGIWLATASATGATGVGIEITAIGKLIHAHQMYRLIQESRSSEDRVTRKWLSKLEDKYPVERGHWTVESMKQLVAKLDQSGDLCNGTLKAKRPRNPSRAKLLKKRMALPRDLLRHMAK